jgi:hypothetical protein
MGLRGSNWRAGDKFLPLSAHASATPQRAVSLLPSLVERVRAGLAGAGLRHDLFFAPLLSQIGV